MSEKINHWCVICGKGYHACDSCNQIKSFTPWRTLTDTIEHYQIFSVLQEFNNGIIDKDKAKEMLESFDLSEKDTFKESARIVLDKIFDEDVKTSGSSENSFKKKRKKPVDDVLNVANDSVNDTVKGITLDENFNNENAVITE